MASENWNDDRWDGLEDDLKTNREAVSYLALQVNTLQADVRTLKDEHKQQIANRTNLWLIVASAVSNPLTAVVVYFLTKGK